jgi:hypothetical protein
MFASECLLLCPVHSTLMVCCQCWHNITLLTLSSVKLSWLCPTIKESKSLETQFQKRLLQDFRTMFIVKGYPHLVFPQITQRTKPRRQVKLGDIQQSGFRLRCQWFKVYIYSDMVFIHDFPWKVKDSRPHRPPPAPPPPKEKMVEVLDMGWKWEAMKVFKSFVEKAQLNHNSVNF